MKTKTTLQTEHDTSLGEIVFVSLAALAAAVVLLVTTVLPAEFNVDPLGTGKMLGITGMSDSALQVGALNTQDQAYFQDKYRIVLAPFESMKYKYRLEEGATMLFDWQANG